MMPRVSAAAGVVGVATADGMTVMPSIELRVEFDMGQADDALEALDLIVKSVKAQIEVARG